MPDYYVGSLRFAHLGAVMLFRLPTPLANVLSQFGLYGIAEKMRMEPVLVSLAFHCATEIVWSS